MSHRYARMLTYLILPLFLMVSPGPGRASDGLRELTRQVLFRAQATENPRVAEALRFLVESGALAELHDVLRPAAGIGVSAPSAAPGLTDSSWDLSGKINAVAGAYMKRTYPGERYARKRTYQKPGDPAWKWHVKFNIDEGYASREVFVKVDIRTWTATE